MSESEALHVLLVYRMEQAEESLEEAVLLVGEKHYRAAINRAYYAMFYAVQALLAQKGLRTSKHTGSISLFDTEFVKKNLYDRQFSKWLHELFDLRQGADYGDMMIITEEQANQSLQHAQTFVHQIKSNLTPQS
jgi:uncharacterized protein (UPF0332 family)